MAKEFLTDVKIIGELDAIKEVRSHQVKSAPGTPDEPGVAVRVGYLYNVHTGSSFATEPNLPIFDVSSSLTITAYVSGDWTPDSDQSFVSKWGAAGSRDWALYVTTTGNLKLAWTEDGSTEKSVTSAAPVTFPTGPGWVQVVFQPVFGGNHFIWFRQSSNGADWVNVGTPVTETGETSVFASDTPILFSSVNDGSGAHWDGRIYRVALAVDGTEVLDADFSTAVAGATSLLDSANGQRILLFGLAAISASPDYGLLAREGTLGLVVNGVESLELTTSDAIFGGDLEVTGNSTVGGHSTVEGNLTVEGDLVVNGTSLGQIEDLEVLTWMGL